MKRTGLLPLCCVLFGLQAGVGYGRGGGGCLEQGTPILTPSGKVAIEQLKPGDPVLAVVDGKTVPATVKDLYQVQPETFTELTFDARRLRVTSEHPVAVAPGVFRTASSLQAGDAIRVRDDGVLRTLSVAAAVQRPARLPAYNLLVSPGGTYVAGDAMFHNKGCFLPETPIRRADGSETPISRVRPGDALLAFTPDGQIVTAAVQKVLTNTVAEYRRVTTDAMTLQVTEEHPFYTGKGTFKTLEALKPGDSIFAFDGKGLRPQEIRSIEVIREKTVVFNLQTDAPNTFFANGAAVHNKGGGGGGHRSSGGSGKGDDSGISVSIGLMIIAIIIAVISKRKSGKDENLDFLYSPSQVARKKDKTLKLLEFLARQDPSVAPAALEDTARATFLRLQKCWQARDYGPMKELMMPALFTEHTAQIQGMIRNHEINIIADLAVDRIDLVNIRYTLKAPERSFTALISARATDYYLDDRTNQRLRGDMSPARFQEFWTFQFQNSRWLLREIEQTGESDALKEDNFFEQFTDMGVDQIYGKEAGREGPAGPWLEKDAEIKDTRIERLLNFLVQTDKLWDRAAMLETARTVFLQTMLAWEAGDTATAPLPDAFPELAADFRRQIDEWKARKIAVEYRNLCVRKVELVLVRNFNDNRKDEYVARVRAHAQKIIRQGDNVVSEDEYVMPFEQYLTFGRLDGAWKLKEFLLPAEVSGLVRRENIDQDSSRDQLQWYYQHKRAV